MYLVVLCRGKLLVAYILFCKYLSCFTIQNLESIWIFYNQLQCASLPSLFFLTPPWYDSLCSTVQFLRCHLPALVISCMPHSSSDVISAAWMRNAVFQYLIFKPLSYHAYLSSSFHSLFLKAFMWKVFLMLCFPPAISVPCEIVIISGSQFCLGHHRLLTSGRE